MTRENKLALVVGFGLILFVGILISDHFSIVRNQKAADLTRHVALEPIHNRIENVPVIDLTPGVKAPLLTTGTPAVSPGTINADTTLDRVRPEHRTTVDPNAAVQPHRIVMQVEQSVPPSLPHFQSVLSEPEAIQVKVKHHDVRGGETLYAVCRQYYGDVSLVNALARFNKIDNAASLRVGRRLLIPPAEQLGGTASTSTAAALAPTSTQSSPAAKPATYTVKAGDSLASIAQRFLGSSKKWKKLHEMNEEVLEDPDSLQIGMVLRVS